MATLLVSLFIRCAHAVPFEDVQVLLGRYCVDCHAGDDAESGIAIDTYTASRFSYNRSRELEKNPSSGAG